MKINPQNEVEFQLQQSELYAGFSARANGNSASLSEALKTGMEANNITCLVERNNEKTG